MEIARADVVEVGVAEDVVAPVFGRNVAAALADDEGHLGLVVGLGGVFGQHDGLAAPDRGGGKLGEDGGHLGDLQFGFEGVGAIVEADTNDFGRAEQRRAQLDGGGFDDLAPGRIVEPALDAVERIGASGQHGQQVWESRAAEADDFVAVEDAGLRVGVALEG